MTRSPLAYPLNRSADMDAGGAADLQTDIMRFMAILSLCLVAIFALVQSIPLQPAEPVNSREQAEVATTATAVALPAAKEPPESVSPAQPSATAQTEPAVTLTRPKWVPKFVPERKKPEEATAITTPQPPTAAPVQSEPVAETPTPLESEAEGFTLRFESDAALTRLVAAKSIGVYAVGTSRAQRMTVSESRISFWDASIPNTFHEMETATVPAAVIEALARSGTAARRSELGRDAASPAKGETR